MQLKSLNISFIKCIIYTNLFYFKICTIQLKFPKNVNNNDGKKIKKKINNLKTYNMCITK